MNEMVVVVVMENDGNMGVDVMLHEMKKVEAEVVTVENCKTW